MTTQAPKGPPYMPQTWSLGGRPEKGVDIPATAVFLVLFIIGAASHMAIFQINRRRNHKFFFSALIFGFCMARIVTCIIRIASNALPTDLSLAIAAQIFTAAGVVILFIVNLVFAQRLIRSSHPTFGWHAVFSAVLKFIYMLILVTIVMIIVVVVQSFYTANAYTHQIDRDILLYGVTTFAVISFLPIPMTLATMLVPRRNDRPIDKFGQGEWQHKAMILLAGTTLISFGACYRAGTSWLTPVPLQRPRPGLLGKGPFYIANFTVEILTVYMYALARVDKRFHVPDGSKQYKSYEKTAAIGAKALGAPAERPRATPETRFIPSRAMSALSNSSWHHLRGDADHSGNNVDVERQGVDSALAGGRRAVAASHIHHDHSSASAGSLHQASDEDLKASDEKL